MKMPAITPGPWAFDGRISAVNEEQRTVAMTYPDMRLSSDDSLSRMRANAIAIAAVPALLKDGIALLEAAERHIFGDECKVEREAFRATLHLAGAK